MEKITANKTKIITEKKTQFVLEGDFLRQTEETTTYEVTYDTNEKKRLTKEKSRKQISCSKTILYEFQLTEILKKEIPQLRREKTPSFVLKVGDRYYHTYIPKKLKFIGASIFGPHKCGICNRMSAACDAEGGCKKIRENSTGIERYPFVTVGFETFGYNYGRSAFFVGECANFEALPERKKMSPSEVNKLKLGLAQFMWEDGVSDMAEVYRRRELNREKMREEEAKKKKG